ncbi:MAG: hypothetical protein ABJA67_06160 [Chthonomonadales bacterium]
MPEDIRVHLRECDDCRNFVRQWNSIEIAIQKSKAEVITPSMGFLQNLQTNLHVEPKRQPRQFNFRLNRLSFAGAFAAIIVLAILLRIGIGISARNTTEPVRPYAIEHSADTPSNSGSPSNR